MQVVAKRTLSEFYGRHPRAKEALEEWHAIAVRADWATPDDIRAAWGKGVDFISDNRVIFDIRGNEFRLVVHVSYRFKSILIKFVGTHSDYDRINAAEVGR